MNIIYEDQINWPVVAEKDLIEEKVNFVVQINGKKRAILNIKRDMIKNDIIEIIKINAEVIKFLKEQEIKKSIFVPNRLINIII